MNGHTVVSVGEALVDIIEQRDGSVEEHVGGSPANVALTLGRLGHDSHLLTHIGTDTRGLRVAAHLQHSRVRLVAGSTEAAHTSTARATLDETGAATYTFNLRWQLPSPLPTVPDGTVCVHTGSIAAILEPGGSQVAEFCRAAHTGATITYDPNLRPHIMDSPGQIRERLEALVALADIVKVSDEDLAWYEPDTDPEALAQRWQACGPSLVVVTRGGEGAVGFTSEGRAEIPSQPVSVVDTVGAGDTFMAGLIDGLGYAGLLGATNRAGLQSLTPGDTKAILEHAGRLAAVTVSRAGANTPWRDEVYPKQAQVEQAPVT